MGLAAVVVAVVVGGWVWLGRPHGAAVPVTANGGAASSRAVSSAGPPSASAGSARASPFDLVVDVVGKVHRPGVCHLPAGSRVADALAAAGGALAGVDLSTLNLARKLADGEQVAVGVSGAPVAATGDPPGPAGAASATSGTPIDLNLATVEQLDTLPGVGPVLAQHIVQWRTEHGRFDTVDQLRQVSGIGPSKFASLHSLVTV